jgi:hypothetical protein
MSEGVNPGGFCEKHGHSFVLCCKDCGMEASAFHDALDDQLYRNSDYAHLAITDEKGESRCIKVPVWFGGEGEQLKPSSFGVSSFKLLRFESAR